MNVNLNNTDNNDYVRGYKDGKIAGATAEAEKLQQAEKQIKDLKEALQNLVDELPKGEGLRNYFAKEQLIYARGILLLTNPPK